MALTHYLDLRLSADGELHPSHALAALFTRLHLYLARTGEQGLAVSFPALARNAAGKARQLGDVLRVQGSGDALTPLSKAAAWGGAASVVHLGSVQAVPANAKHHAIRRIQVDSNPERLMRRAMKRKGWSEAEALEKYAQARAVRTDLPYVSLHSQSSGQQFRLFLDISQPTLQAIEGSFNAYGLSKDATVPLF